MLVLALLCYLSCTFASRILVGFVNLGNTCYMNAALQLLANIPLVEKTFTDAVSLLDFDDEIFLIDQRLWANLKEFTKTEYLIKELKDIKSALRESMNSDPELLDLEKQLKDLGFDDVAGHPAFLAKQEEVYSKIKAANCQVYEQHESLMNSLEPQRLDKQKIRFVPVVIKLLDLFVERRYIIESPSVNRKGLSKSLESFHKLIKKVFNLGENYSQQDGNEVFVRIIHMLSHFDCFKTISSYFKGQNLTTKNCNDFIEIYVQRKMNLLEEIVRMKEKIFFGKIVIFKLFRLMADEQRICNEPVKYPMTFSLDESYSEDAVYHLYGVMVRSGANEDAGHYFALARDFQNPSPNWSIFNDLSVSPIGSKDLLGYKTSVTMLIYVKQSEIPRVFDTDLPWYESTEDVDFLKEYSKNSKKNEIIPHVQERLDVLLGRKKSDSKSKKEMENSYSEKNQENEDKGNSKEWKASDDPSSFKKTVHPEFDNYGTIKYSSNSKSRKISTRDQKIPFERDAETQEKYSKNVSKDSKIRPNRSKKSSFSSNSSLPSTNENEYSKASTGAIGYSEFSASFESHDLKKEENPTSRLENSNGPDPDSFMADLKMEFWESLVNRLKILTRDLHINREQMAAMLVFYLVLIWELFLK